MTALKNLFSRNMPTATAENAKNAERNINRVTDTFGGTPDPKPLHRFGKVIV